MIETEYEKIPHPSRDIEFKDDMKDFIIWWELFKEEIFSKNFKETNFLDIMTETSEKNRNSISGVSS
ncbi:hypothetical protein METP2_02801 [Methanosarcinales archaeon]|nr:hypothetical protein METP2_02801 [Methanosarcinales archaeon]